MIAHKLPEGSKFIELGCLLGKSTNFLASRLKELNKKFVIDFRKPNVLRVAPVPLYNSYKEVYHFVKELDLLINS